MSERVDVIAAVTVAATRADVFGVSVFRTGRLKRLAFVAVAERGNLYVRAADIFAAVGTIYYRIIPAVFSTGRLKFVFSSRCRRVRMRNSKRYRISVSAAATIICGTQTIRLTGNEKRIRI